MADRLEQLRSAWPGGVEFNSTLVDRAITGRPLSTRRSGRRRRARSPGPRARQSWFLSVTSPTTALNRRARHTRYAAISPRKPRASGIFDDALGSVAMGFAAPPLRMPVL